MHQIECPWCGKRDEAEFQYQGDATKKRPAPDASADIDESAREEAFFDYVYMRHNPKGWHVEWWHHVGGCRQWIKVVRHTMTHEIHATGLAQDELEVPKDLAKNVAKDIGS